MNIETVTTRHYTFCDGDVVAHKLGAGAIVRLLIRRQPAYNGHWFNVDGTESGLTDTDIKENLESFSDKWRYLGNKYEVFK